MKYLYELIDYDPATVNLGTCVDDIHKKYVNTLMHVILDNDEPLLGSLVRINTSGIDIDIRGQASHIQHKNVKEMKPFLPESGYYQYETGGFYLKKKIRKQYKASYCPDLYHTYIWGGGSIENSLKPLPKYPFTIDEIDIDSPRVALNKHLCVNPDNKLSLLYDQVRIGEINAKRKCITLNIPSVMQEVKDYLNNKRLGDVWKLTLQK